MLPDMLKLRQTVEDIVRETGQSLLVPYFNENLSRSMKKDASIVTEADVASEKFLIEKLATAFPQAAFFAEESGLNGESDYCWVIDPLDGTTNFVHHIPYFCISVALTYKNEPVLGVIYQPILKEMFSAVKGKGAFLNAKSIKVSDIKNFDESFLGIGIPYRQDDAYRECFLRNFSTIMKNTYSFRYFGAIALDLAYVASGRFDAIFFENLFWWDFAAGTLLIEEAGGIVSDFQNNVIGPSSMSYLGTNKYMHSSLIKLLAF